MTNKRKVYVILTGTITRMGGAQMYVSNKEKYMRKLGWDVYVFSCRNGPMYITSLAKYKNGILPELEYSPCLYDKRTRNKMIIKMTGIASITSDCTVLVESNTGHMALWAELLSRHIGSKHFSFLLDESFDFDDAYVDFFWYKYRRKELALIMDDSYELLFGKGDFSYGKPVLKAKCNNVVEDVCDERFERIQYDNYDWVLCCIGRLNKSFIPKAIQGMKELSVEHPEKKIAIVFIGNQPEGSTPDMRLVINEQLDSLENVDCYLQGYVFPIPYSFFSHVDVGVSSAGSAVVLCNNAVPTIVIDACDGAPIGVLGYTTHNLLYRDGQDNRENDTLKTLLNRILLTDYLQSIPFDPLPDTSIDMAFKEHMRLIHESTRQKSYYDITSIHLKRNSERIKKIIISCFGLKIYRYIKKICFNK